ncbi:hypothetical protein CAPTEDRAFT_44169, partial [Capitella teleta]
FAAVAAVLLNTLVLRTMWHNRGQLKPIEGLIALLACNDIFMVAGGFPLQVHSSFAHTWKYGETGCSIYAFLVFLGGIANIYILMTLSVLRFIKICCSQKYGRRISGRVVAILAVLVYLLALVLSLCPLFGWGEYGPSEHGSLCTLKWRRHRDYLATIFIVVFFVPLGSMAISYSRICCTLHRLNRTISSVRREVQIVRMSGFMCVGFLLAWSPYAIISMIYAFGNPDIAIPPWISATMSLFAKSSTCYNPCIYFIMNRKFRKLIEKEFR